MKVCVIIPSYNTGYLLQKTVEDVLSEIGEVMVVIDGSTDGSDEILADWVESSDYPNLCIHMLTENSGKGAAVLSGIGYARAQSYTHALVMDADGQHPISHISRFVELSRRYPEALILGDPIYDESAPAVRVGGHKISNWWANVLTCGWGIGDSLFGMRLYPITALGCVFDETSWARRFDFDPEVAIRMCWRGVPAINLPTPCRYLTKEEGGVSHFRYLRDNVLLTWMYARLLAIFLLRWPYFMLRSGNPLKGVIHSIEGTDGRT